MSDEIRVVVAVAADEGENFLGWRVERTVDGWRCRIWVLHNCDDGPVDLATLSVPETDPDFEGTMASEEGAIDFLADEDMFLRNAAIELIAELSSK